MRPLPQPGGMGVFPPALSPIRVIFPGILQLSGKFQEIGLLSGECQGKNLVRENYCF